MTDSQDSCTCKNRSLRLDEAIMFIRPNLTGFITAKDCPLHGMRDLTNYSTHEPTVNLPVVRTVDESL